MGWQSRNCQGGKDAAGRGGHRNGLGYIDLTENGGLRNQFLPGNLFLNSLGFVRFFIKTSFCSGQFAPSP
jgi:hypothetical protein